MRSRLRVWVIATGVAVLVLFGVVIVSVVFPMVSTARRQRIIQWWSHCLLAWCGVTLVVAGRGRGNTLVDAALRPGGVGALLVMNHVSWLDIYVVYAVRAAHFIAKAEIATWPVVGYLVRKTGTVFIERGKRHAVRDANARITALLESGELVGMFPEGTVGDGTRLLPFHANLLQPAVTTGTPVVVAGVRYRNLDGSATEATLYTGGITLFESLARIARHGPIVAELHLIDTIDTASIDRHEVARRARVLVVEALALPDDADAPAPVPSRVSVSPMPPRTERETRCDLQDVSP